MTLFRVARNTAPILLVFVGACLDWPDSALNIDARLTDGAADLKQSGDIGGEQVADLLVDTGGPDLPADLAPDQPVADLNILDAMKLDGPVKPDMPKPDMPKPDMPKPDMPKVKLDGAKPDKPKPDMKKPDMAKPDMHKPDMTKPDMMKPDLLQPDQAIPDLNMGPLTNGKSCLLSSQCYSGNCADGFCCDFPCTSSCKQCDAKGKQGVCVPVGAGAAPRKGQCTVSTNLCGQDGKCDGIGGCRNRSGGTVCKKAQCSSADPIKLDLPHMCDGKGTCANLTTIHKETDCGDYLCNPGTAACHASCTSNAQCKTGKTCSLGRCNGKEKPLGTSCSVKGECESDKCVQGVCCESDCNDACKTCKLPGAPGRCLPVPYGVMPTTPKSCSVNKPCGEDGYCDGSGKCRRSLSGTSCGNICKNDASKSYIEVGTCNGGGGCGDVVYGCGNYKCDLTLDFCHGRCTSNSHCIAGFTCKGGKCAL